MYEQKGCVRLRMKAKSFETQVTDLSIFSDLVYVKSKIFFWCNVSLSLVQLTKNVARKGITFDKSFANSVFKIQNVAALHI